MPRCATRPRAVSLVAVATAGALIVSVPRVVLAQADAAAGGAAAGQLALSREYFRAGIDAAQQQHWPAALAQFERSYALAPRPLTLLNVAGAQVESGHLVAGTESYRRFLAQATGTAAERYREQAAQTLATLLPRLARARITVRNAARGDRIEVDGVALSAAAVGSDLPLDPGPHVLELRRGERVVASARVALAEGAVRTIALVAPAPAPAALRFAPAARPRRLGAGSALAIGLGSAVLVAAAVTVVTLFATGVFETGYARLPYAGDLDPIHVP